MDNFILITEQLNSLIDELNLSNNDSATFFETIREKIKSDKTRNEALNELEKCFAITQYANFNYKEEKILSEIIINVSKLSRKY